MEVKEDIFSIGHTSGLIATELECFVPAKNRRKVWIAFVLHAFFCGAFLQLARHNCQNIPLVYLCTSVWVSFRICPDQNFYIYVILPSKDVPLGCFSGARVRLMTCWYEFDTWLRRIFFPAYFHFSPLLKHVRKVVGGFGKKVMLVLV